MLTAKFHDHRTIRSVGEDFEGVYHIWAWRPSWSCDLDHLYKLSFPLPKGLHMKSGLIGQEDLEKKFYCKEWSYTCI